MNKNLKLIMIGLTFLLLISNKGQAKLHFGVISLVKEKIDELKGNIYGKVVVKSYSYDHDNEGNCNGRYCFLGTLTLTNLDGIRVVLYSNGKAVKSTTVVGNSYKFTGVAPGEYTIKAKVTDEIWNTNETLSVKLTSKENIGGPILEFDKITVGNINVVCYPNPFRPRQEHTSISFERLPQDVDIWIYNLTGGLVKSTSGIISGIWQWDVKNDSGEPLPSGVYFYKICDSLNNYLINNLIVER
ncbi:MAG: hypothetical protein AB1414_14085 [bacterium]